MLSVVMSCFPPKRYFLSTISGNPMETGCFTEPSFSSESVEYIWGQLWPLGQVRASELCYKGGWLDCRRAGTLWGSDCILLSYDSPQLWSRTQVDTSSQLLFHGHLRNRHITDQIKAGSEFPSWDRVYTYLHLKVNNQQPTKIINKINLNKINFAYFNLH